MEITEEWVRGLTGWKPFKDGKAMASQGLVSGFKESRDGCQGSIREGRLSLRPVVRIAGPTDVRVQCGCPDHRATGGVCAHAVAVLLTSLKPADSPVKPVASPVGTPRPERVTSVEAVIEGTSQAWNLRFSPRPEAEWSSGKLSLRLLPSGADTSPDEADRRISAWLAARKLLPRSPRALALRLDGEEAAGFLDLAAGHARTEIDGRPGIFQIHADFAPPLRLADSRIEGSQVMLDLAAGDIGRSLVRWGSSPAWLSDDGVQRLPGSPEGPDWSAKVFRLVKSGRLKLPVGEFLADVETWLDLFEDPRPGWLGELRLAGVRPDFELEIEGSLDALDAMLMVRYPGLTARPLPPPDEVMAGLPCLAPDGSLLVRNPVDEEHACLRLLALGFVRGGKASGSISSVGGCPSSRARFELRGHDAVLSFLADGLPSLRHAWTVREGLRFAESARRVHVVRPEIQETALDGSLTFELSFQTNAGNRIPSSEIRRLLGRGGRTTKLSNGSELVLSRSCEELVLPLAAELGIGRPDEPFQLSGASAMLFQNLGKIINKPPNENALEAKKASFNQMGLKAELRPYQASGADWLVERLSQLQGALLADEMGLGKTIQTIAAINHFKQQEEAGNHITLVVAPATLLGNWMAEFARFAPRLRCLLFHGSTRDRLRSRVGEVDVIVTSYGSLVRDLAFHLQRDYRLIAADEASLLRNPDAEISRSLCKLRGDYRLALTGTPVENRLQDLWSIFRFIAPGYLGGRAEFKERYESADQTAPAGSLGRLRLRISPFVLRRTKDQVAKDLPDKIEIDEWLDLGSAQAELYASLARAGLEEIERIRDRQGEGAGRMHLLTLLLRLRQACVNPGLLDLPDLDASSAVKIERLLEMLRERKENAKKTLVFSQFATNLRQVEKLISEGFGRVFCLDGSTAKRQELVDAFQSEPGPAVFLISLKAGGYGLNLTAADTVIHLDPWWNPAVEAQATDRAHRIGQTRNVTVYRLLTRGTVEERVRRMQERKRAVIDAATGDSGSAPSNWTRRDLEELLR
jgi:superfamily II DNA or RNA helicase